MRLFRVFMLLPLLFIGQAANALIIPATDSGWYLDTGNHDPANQNFVTGYSTDGIVSQSPTELRNFFVFDLSGVGAVSNAILRAWLVSEVGHSEPGYISPDPSETWGLFDVTSSLAKLMAGTGGVNTFADLGSGLAYGEAIVTPADMGSFIDVPLNADALGSIGAAGGLWGVGGRLLTTGGAETQIIFAWSQEDLRVELVLTPAVPVPTTPYLLALALGVLCWLRGSRGPCVRASLKL